MSKMLSDVYAKLHSNNKQAYQSYWSPIRYTGYVLDEINIIQSVKHIKEQLLSRVRNSLQGDYSKLDSVYVDTVVSTTVFGSGFILTSLEAVELISSIVNILSDYRLLATHISPISVKERLRKIIDPDRKGVDIAFYLNQKCLKPLLPTVSDITYQFPETLLTVSGFSNTASYLELLYKIFTPVIYKCVAKGYNRGLIYQTIRSEFYLYLQGQTVLMNEGTVLPSVIMPFIKDSAISALHYLRREVTGNYYEPLLYTRTEGVQDLVTKTETFNPLQLIDAHSIMFLEYADVYSKVVRIANIRRRLIVQDIRYIISEALASAFRHYIKANEVCM